MKRRAPEQALQIAVAQYLRVALKPPVVWTAIGHGGGGRVRGAILKAMGLAKGWPDVLIIAPGPNVIGLELKAKAGRQTPEQADIQKSFFGCKAWYALCKDVEGVEKVLRFCKVPLHASVAAKEAA